MDHILSIIVVGQFVIEAVLVLALVFVVARRSPTMKIDAGKVAQVRPATSRYGGKLFQEPVGLRQAAQVAAHGGPTEDEESE